MANLPTGPRQWTDGEEPDNIPSADDLNLDWRDNLNFLVGNQRPFIYVESSTSLNITPANTYVTQGWQIEFVKRGDMVHAANSTDITVPVTGQYQGFAVAGLSSVVSLTTRTFVRVLRGGTQVAIANQRPEVTTNQQVHLSFTLDLSANDVITMQTKCDTTTGTTVGASGLGRPKLALWYVGKYI